jgi:hypothetical protein
MKTFIIAVPLLFSALLGGCYAPIPKADEIRSADYGPFPTDYKDMVNEWLLRDLYDPHSLQDLEITPPVQVYERRNIMDGGGVIYGWGIDVYYRAKNRLGGYTGLKHYGLLIRDDKIISKRELSE